MGEPLSDESQQMDGFGSPEHEAGEQERQGYDETAGCQPRDRTGHQVRGQPARRRRDRRGRHRAGQGERDRPCLLYTSLMARG
uniref:hypothetical protein n=1 Tax=Streptomyces sp. rh79 TaxID=3028727 RepID=UPI003C7E3F52